MSSIVLLLATAVFAGCESNGPQRYQFAGTVTYYGKPVPAGIMYFDPDVATGNDGPQGHATIAHGVFDTSQTGQGPGSGKYLVRVYAHDGVPVPELPMGKPLFPEAVITIDLPTKNANDLKLEVTPPGR